MRCQVSEQHSVRTIMDRGDFLAHLGFDVPPALSMTHTAPSSTDQLLAELERTESSRPRTAADNNVMNVFFCFFAPGGATPKSGLSRAVFRLTSLMKEHFVHVECLFRIGSSDGRHSYYALTVSEKDGCGIQARTLEYFHSGRWEIWTFNNLSQKTRNQMWTFACRQASMNRSYNHGAVISAVPIISCCNPVVKYTPGCGSLVGSGPQTVFCAQLMWELLDATFPTQFSDINADSVRPQQVLHEMQRRIPDVVQQIILTLDTQDRQATQRAMLDFAGTDMWAPPRQ